MSARKENLIDLLADGTPLPLPNNSQASLFGPACTPPATPPTSTDLAQIIAQAISTHITPPQATLDPEQVAEIAREAISPEIETLRNLLADRPAPTVYEINIGGTMATLDTSAELMHRQTAQALAWIAAGVPLWLWGSPGAGKTHMARQIAEALGVGCFVMSIDETTTANKLLGFQNLVSGDFVPGWLYEPYKNGGLVMVDEIDTGNPGILAALNALISNGHYLFPNGETVTKHPKFYICAGANTNGTGAIAGFTARQRLDAATLNRFAQVRLEYDEDLERAVATSQPITTDRKLWKPGKPATPETLNKWIDWIQAIRTQAGESVLISPRPSILGCKALAAGIPIAEVAEALIFALCNADTKKRILDRNPLPQED